MEKIKTKLDKIEEFTYKIFSIFMNVVIPVIAVLAIVILTKLFLSIKGKC